MVNVYAEVAFLKLCHLVETYGPFFEFVGFERTKSSVFGDISRLRGQIAIELGDESMSDGLEVLAENISQTLLREEILSFDINERLNGWIL